MNYLKLQNLFSLVEPTKQKLVQKLKELGQLHGWFPVDVSWVFNPADWEVLKHIYNGASTEEKGSESELVIIEEKDGLPVVAVLYYKIWDHRSELQAELRVNKAGYVVYLADY